MADHHLSCRSHVDESHPQISATKPIDVGNPDFLTMVKHSYPDFHIAFHCFLVDIETSQINLTGHVVKQWLDVDVLLSFDWTAADILAGQKIIDNYR